MVVRQMGPSQGALESKREVRKKDKTKNDKCKEKNHI